MVEVLKSWLSCHVLCLLASEVFRSGIRFFFPPKNNTSHLVDNCWRSKYFAWPSAPVTTIFYHDVCCYCRAGLDCESSFSSTVSIRPFLAVFKLLVNPFGLTHWLLVGISAGHELQVLQVADIVYPSMFPLTQKGCDCMLFTITNPLLLGDWESCPTSSAHFG